MESTSDFVASPEERIVVFAQSDVKAERQLWQLLFQSLIVRAVGIVVEVLHLQFVITHEHLVLQIQAERLTRQALQYVHTSEGHKHQQTEVRDVPCLIPNCASVVAAEEIILDFYVQSAILFSSMGGRKISRLGGKSSPLLFVLPLL